MSQSGAHPPGYDQPRDVTDAYPTSNVGPLTIRGLVVRASPDSNLERRVETLERALREPDTRTGRARIATAGGSR